MCLLVSGTGVSISGCDVCVGEWARGSVGGCGMSVCW